MADAVANGLSPNLSSYSGYDATNKLLATATNSPENLNSWLTAARQGQALHQSQVDLANQQLGVMNGMAASVLAAPTLDNATSQLQRGIRLNIVPADEGARELATLSQMGDDPAKIKAWAYQHMGNIMSAQQLMSQGYGDPGLVNNGQQDVPIRTVTGPNAGVYAAGGNALQQYMPPGQASAPTSYTDAQGRTINTTVRGYGQAVGDTSGLPPTQGAPGPAAAPPPGSPPPGYSGVGNPSSYVDPNRAATAGVRMVNGQPVYGAAPSMPPVPPGTQPGDVIKPGAVGGKAGSLPNGPTVAGPGINAPAAGGVPQPSVPGIPGPPPGYADAAKLTGAASAEQGIALQKAADGAPVRKGMLANLNDDLDHFTSGPGADWQQVGKAWANRNVLPTSMQFDPQSIASQEGFNKQATQLAQQQFQALGGTGTDSQLSSTFKANPNQALSQLGNRQIIQLLRGNEDALQAKAAAWQRWQQQNGPNTYGQFQQDFNRTYNPRVYQAMYMDPQQIADMRKNMSPAEQQQFARDYVALKAKGYITPGGAGGQ